MTTTVTPAATATPAPVPAPLPPVPVVPDDAMPLDRVAGWVWPLVITAVAGFLRFWRLGEPRAFVFDETYYAKDAQALLQSGYERSAVDKANELVLSGRVDVFKDEPSFIAHPPAGKWVIAAGEQLFGFEPFGWRFSVAVLGTLSVLMLARIGRRLFRSTLLGCTAGALLALDALHFVHSRTALLDLILTVFALGAFGCLLVDRDAARTRARLDGRGRVRLPWWRPWRVAAGVLLGLACATKWSGIPFLAVFGLLTVVWDLGARRAAGARRPFVPALLRDAPLAFLAVVPAAVAAYLVSWAGWFTSDGKAWGRTWAATNPSDLPVPDALRSLWDYHRQMWEFNKGLNAFHPYASNPWSWLIQARPVSFFYEGPTQGQAGCEVAQCSQAVTALGTPLLWWGGIAAVAVTLFLWALRRDWRAGAVLAGLAAGYLPWFAFQGRTVYSFYAIAFLPWVVLALTLCLGLVLGPRGASRRRRRWGAALAGGYVVLVAANFVYLWPIVTSTVIPYASWSARMWFSSWI